VGTSACQAIDITVFENGIKSVKRKLAGQNSASFNGRNNEEDV
jgi:hypothetical protein